MDPPKSEKESTVEQCGCVRKIMAARNDNGEYDDRFGYNSSTCSRHSYDRGPGQKVFPLFWGENVMVNLFINVQTIGFSFYGNPDSKLGKERKYFEGIMENLALIPKYYPGWVLR